MRGAAGGKLPDRKAGDAGGMTRLVSNREKKDTRAMNQPEQRHLRGSAWGNGGD